VSPGPIETNMYQRFISGNEEIKHYLDEMQPIGRVDIPDEIASAVIWLCSPGAAFDRSTDIDGGFTAQ
jgi:NAD(P)-dependent dehydrogenase (short-subunit alcohol dehydrogenase family)